MFQLVYISTSSPGIVVARETDAILRVSQRNNSRDEITGLLYADQGRFMQVLEGPAKAVNMTYDRISADTRHRAAVILSRREIEQREFGDWAMASQRSSDEAAVFMQRIERLLRNASPVVRASFEGFVKLRRAA